MNLPLRSVLAGLALALAGTAHSATPALAPKAARAPAVPKGGAVAEGTLDEENIVKARAAGRVQGFTWEKWSKEAFERARREHRLLLLDGAAEWCHWCHVMDETTYRDPEVGRILEERFVAIRVDIDERPDFADRYGDWGWPATIILSPEAEELGKFRGYLPVDRFLEILHELEAVGSNGAKADAGKRGPGAPVAALAWIAERATRDLDDRYDTDLGGWGKRRKSPMGMNLLFELRRAEHGDAKALERAKLTFEKQRALLDPVWGGVYQYSVEGRWNSPHFEKLMAFQAANLEAYARGYQVAQVPALLTDAKGIVRYIHGFLTAPDGTFYVNQDADLNAHDAKGAFVDGHVFYALDDAGRRKLGTPWVDTHVYAQANGLALQALASLYEVTKDAEVLGQARKAADALARTHVTKEGDVRREASTKAGPYYLADAASLGFGYARLALATGDAGYRELSLRIAQRLVAGLYDEASGAYFDHTVDPDGVGVFAHRRLPFTYNVAVARYFASLAKLTGDASWQERGRRALAGVASPANLDGEGGWLGEFLLAADELGVYPW